MKTYTNMILFFEMIKQYFRSTCVSNSFLEKNFDGRENRHSLFHVHNMESFENPSQI